MSLLVFLKANKKFQKMILFTFKRHAICKKIKICICSTSKEKLWTGGRKGMQYNEPYNLSHDTHTFPFLWSRMSVLFNTSIQMKLGLLPVTTALKVLKSKFFTFHSTLRMKVMAQMKWKCAFRDALWHYSSQDRVEFTNCIRLTLCISLNFNQSTTK